MLWPAGLSYGGLCIGHAHIPYSNALNAKGKPKTTCQAKNAGRQVIVVGPVATLPTCIECLMRPLNTENSNLQGALPWWLASSFIDAS